MDKLKNKNIIFIDVLKQMFVVNGDDEPIGAVNSVKTSDFKEITIKMLNHLISHNEYTLNDFLEKIIIDFDDNQIIVYMQGKLTPEKRVYSIENLNQKYYEYVYQKKSAEEEIEEIYNIIRYDNEEAKERVNLFFERKSIYLSSLDKIESLISEIKSYHLLIGNQNNIDEINMMLNDICRDEIVEMLDMVTENNINEFISESAYEIANLFQFLDMELRKLSKIILFLNIEKHEIEKNGLVSHKLS